MSTLLDGASVFVENNNGSVALEAKGGNIIVRNSGNNVAGDKSFAAKGNNDSTIALINVTTDVNSTFTNRFVSENGASIVTVDNAKELDIVGSSNSDIIVVNNLKMDIVNAGDASDIVRINGGNVISVDAGDGNDIVVASGTGHVIDGGSGNDILRIDKKAGNNITVNGGAGNDIITVASGNGHILVGGAGNDKYVINLLEANANYTIDQQSALTSDRDILSMSKYNSKDFHVVLNSNNDLLLKHENGAIVTVHDWQNHALNMVYFKDCALNCKELETRVEKTIYINSDGDFDAGDGNYTYIFDFDLPENSEGEWSSVNHIINVYGADSDDSFDMRKYAFGGSIDGYFQRDNINITIQGNDLTISSYIQDQNNLTSMYIACNLKDYMSNGNNLLVLDGQTCAVIGNGIDAVYDAKLADRWCFKGNDFNITLEGVTTDNVLDLTSFYIDDGDGWNFYHKGNDLVFEFSRYSYDENKTKVVGTLTLKNALVDSNARPVIYTCESAMRLKIGTVGADTFTVGDIPNGLFGYFYYGNAGNDRITLDNGISAAFGGDGDDIFYVKNKSNGTFVYGGNGKDTVTIDQKTDGFYNMITDVYVHGGADADNITVNAGQGHVIYGDEGDDAITINKLNIQNDPYIMHNAVIYGGAGNDIIKVDLSQAKGVYIDNEYGYVNGDKDVLQILGLKSTQVDIKYNRSTKILQIYDKNDSLNPILSIEGWNVNPMNSITFTADNKVYNNAALIEMTRVVDVAVLNEYVLNAQNVMENFVVGLYCDSATINCFSSNDSLDLSKFNDCNYGFSYSVIGTRTEMIEDMFGGAYEREKINDILLTVKQYNDNKVKTVAEFTLRNMQFDNNSSELLTLEFFNTTTAKVEEVQQYINQYTDENYFFFAPGDLNLIVDNSLSNFSTLSGNDNITIVEGSHRIDIGNGNDIVTIENGCDYVTINKYLYVASGNDGNDIYNIRSKDVYIVDQSGNDTYNLSWSNDINVTIESSGSEYSTQNFKNTLNIDCNYEDFIIKQIASGPQELLISGKNGGNVTVRNWNNFTFIFNDTDITGAELEEKFKNSKTTVDITSNLHYYCEDDIQETFVAKGTGWIATVEGFSDEDKIDLGAYRNGNYVWGFEPINLDGTESSYTKDALINIYDISSGTLNNIAAIKLVDLFNGDNYEVKSLMIDDYLYGNSSTFSTSVSNCGTCDIRPINGSGQKLTRVDYDNITLYLNSTDKPQTIELNGYNNSVNTSYHDDVIYLNGGSCHGYANSGDDKIYINGGSADFYGDSGNDIFYINSSSGWIHGGEGVDTYIFESISANGSYNIDTVVYSYYDTNELDILDLSKFSIDDFTLSKDGIDNVDLGYRNGAVISVSGWSNGGFKAIKFAEGTYNQAQVEQKFLGKSDGNTIDPIILSGTTEDQGQVQANGGIGNDVIYVTNSYRTMLSGGAGHDKYFVAIDSVEYTDLGLVEGNGGQIFDDSSSDTLIICGSNLNKLMAGFSENHPEYMTIDEFGGNRVFDDEGWGGNITMQGWTENPLSTIKVLDNSTDKAYSIEFSAIRNALQDGSLMNDDGVICFADISGWTETSLSSDADNAMLNTLKAKVAGSI